MDGLHGFVAKDLEAKITTITKLCLIIQCNPYRMAGHGRWFVLPVPPLLGSLDFGIESQRRLPRRILMQPDQLRTRR